MKTTGLNYMITMRCNRRCPHCCCGMGNVDLWDADEDYVKRWAPVFSGLERINVIGGEPFMHPDFDRIAECIMESFPGLEMRVSTNGDMWERHRDILHRFDMIEVSNYGEWTFAGCPDNTGKVEGLLATYGSTVNVNRIVHEEGTPGNDLPCDVFQGSTLEFNQGVLYHCCAGSGFPHSAGITPGKNWRSEIASFPPHCLGCPFAK